MANKRIHQDVSSSSGRGGEGGEGLRSSVGASLKNSLKRKRFNRDFFVA